MWPLEDDKNKGRSATLRYGQTNLPSSGESIDRHNPISDPARSHEAQAVLLYV